MGLEIRRPFTDWLTVGQVASRLKLSTATVYKLIETGALRHRRIRNCIRVPAYELENIGKSPEVKTQVVESPAAIAVPAAMHRAATLASALDALVLLS